MAQRKKNGDSATILSERVYIDFLYSQYATIIRQGMEFINEIKKEQTLKKFIGIVDATEFYKTQQYSISIPGIVLGGPPGTGKTTFAKPFIELLEKDLNSMFKGQKIKTVTNGKVVYFTLLDNEKGGKESLGKLNRKIGLTNTILSMASSIVPSSMLVATMTTLLTNVISLPDKIEFFGQNPERQLSGMPDQTVLQLAGVPIDTSLFKTMGVITACISVAVVPLLRLGALSTMSSLVAEKFVASQKEGNYTEIEPVKVWNVDGDRPNAPLVICYHPHGDSVEQLKRQNNPGLNPGVIVTAAPTNLVEEVLKPIMREKNSPFKGLSLSYEHDIDQKDNLKIVLAAIIKERTETTCSDEQLEGLASIFIEDVNGYPKIHCTRERMKLNRLLEKLVIMSQLSVNT